SALANLNKVLKVVFPLMELLSEITLCMLNEIQDQLPEEIIIKLLVRLLGIAIVILGAFFISPIFEKQFGFDKKGFFSDNLGERLGTSWIQIGAWNVTTMIEWIAYRRLLFTVLLLTTAWQNIVK
ncbi:37008_t:CDS:1, partial [Racocetra persica]